MDQPVAVVKEPEERPEQESGQGPEPEKGRRAVLIGLVSIALAWLAAGLWPVYRYLKPAAGADPFGEEGKAKVSKITPADVARPGTGANGSYAGRGVIVLRAPDGELRAFDAKCTHAGCNVTYAGTSIKCPCHGGVYDLDGRNIAGPPPRPLTRLAVSEEEGTLYVSKLESGKKA